MYWFGGKAEAALRICRRLIQLDPDNPTYYLNVGAFSAALKRFDSAEKAYEEVVRLMPNSSTGYRALAGLYLNTNRQLPAAKTLAEKAVELEPIAVNYHALSVACEKNGDPAGALAAIQRAAELEPDSAKYRLRLKRLQGGR